MDRTSLLQSCPSDKAASILERQNELNRLLPPLKIGEYDTVVESVAGRGLGLNLEVKEGIICFGGYKKFEDGFKCPAEIIKSIHAVGDEFIAVDGVSLVGLSFKEAFEALVASVGEGNKFVFLRFRGNSTASTSNISTQVSVVQPSSTDAGKTPTVRQPPTILDRSGQPHRRVVSSTDAKSQNGSASTAILPSRTKPLISHTMVWHGHTRIPYPGPSIAQRVEAITEKLLEETPDPGQSRAQRLQAVQKKLIEGTNYPGLSMSQRLQAMEEKLLVETVPRTSSRVNSNVEPATVSDIGKQQLLLQAGGAETVKAPQTSVYRPPSIVEPATFASNHPPSSHSAGTSFGSNRTGTNFLDTKAEQLKTMLPNKQQGSFTSTFAMGSVTQPPQNVHQHPSFNAMGYASASMDMTNVALNSNNGPGPVSHSTPRNAAILQAKQPALPTKSTSVQQMPTQPSNFASTNSSFRQLGNGQISTESNSMEPMLTNVGNASSTQNTTAQVGTNDAEPVPPSDSSPADPSLDHFPRKRLFAFKSILEGRTRSLNGSSIFTCRVLEGKGEEGYKRLHLNRAAVAYATPLDDIDELLEAKQQQTTRNRNGARGQKRSAEAQTSPNSATSAKKQSQPRSLMESSKKGRAPTLVYEGPPLKSLFGGWPDGWTQKTFQRQGSTGRDSYFYGPGSDHRFRSLVEVLRFLGREVVDWSQP